VQKLDRALDRRLRASNLWGREAAAEALAEIRRDERHS